MEFVASGHLRVRKIPLKESSIHFHYYGDHFNPKGVLTGLLYFYYFFSIKNGKFLLEKS
jgi:hypothetical protein